MFSFGGVLNSTKYKDWIVPQALHQGRLYQVEDNPLNTLNSHFVFIYFIIYKPGGNIFSYNIA